jgi:purine-binding chemotaxis protein CheW
VGLVNVRGRLIAAVDLRPLLGLPAQALTADSRLLIVADNTSELGLVADTVVAIHRSSTELSPAPPDASGRSVVWVRGVDEELSIHLDPGLLLADPALLVNAEAEG